MGGNPPKVVVRLPRQCDAASPVKDHDELSVGIHSHLLGRCCSIIAYSLPPKPSAKRSDPSASAALTYALLRAGVDGRLRILRLFEKIGMCHDVCFLGLGNIMPWRSLCLSSPKSRVY